MNPSCPSAVEVNSSLGDQQPVFVRRDDVNTVEAIVALMTRAISRHARPVAA
jgi:hypothetical protein